MSLHEVLPRFDRDWAELDPADRHRFREAVARLIADLQGGRAAAAAGVRAIDGAPGVVALTFGEHGHATFSVGRSESGARPLVVWRRVGRDGRSTAVTRSGGRVGLGRTRSPRR